MIVPAETICRVCKKIFCCADCRHKHEIKTHAIPVRLSKTENSTNCEVNNNNTIYLFCPICEANPLALREEMYDGLLAHIAANHLPLHCLKCSKLYTSFDDLRSFSKCLQPLTNCGADVADEADQTCDTDASKVTVKRAVAPQTTISTQTSPMASQEANSHTDLTPISLMNLRWQTKSKLLHETFSGDSVSSIRNLSSICGIGSLPLVSVPGSVQRVKGKLVRSTSTPVHAALCVGKPKEQTFTCSGGHVSSICHSGSESDHSPPIVHAAQVPPSPRQQQAETVSRYRKASGRAKLAAHTPLRQVMSRSIQKALVEHGLPPTGAATTGSPLDLRLSPAVRRTQSAISFACGNTVPSHTGVDLSTAATTHALPTSHVRREILLSSTKQLTTESIVITRMQRLGVAAAADSLADGSDTNSSSQRNGSANDQSTASSSASVYQTCRSVEIITSTELTAEEVYTSREQASSSELQSAYTPITRLPGAVIGKKFIKFETPQEQESVNATRNVTPAAVTDKPAVDASVDMNVSSPGDEKFFTPSATPMRQTAADSSEERRRLVVPRNLSGHFAVASKPPNAPMAPTKMRGRPTYRRTAHLRSQRPDAENSSNTPAVDTDDEVFLSTAQKSPKAWQACKQQEARKQPVVRSWSFGALVSSMMHWPGIGAPTDAKASSDGDVVASKEPAAASLIKRCASIAGSLVRSRSLLDDEEQQLKSVKRKRTNTLDEQYATYLSSPASSGSQSSNSSGGKRSGARARAPIKRYRIQGRKPIERMRLNFPLAGP